jgi:hypothetical protein
VTLVPSASFFRKTHVGVKPVTGWFAGEDDGSRAITI